MTEAAAPSRTTRRTGTSARLSRAERRQLPTFGAGAVQVPFVILGRYEVITRDTSWAEHSHPTHELLWNERGSSTASIGRRTWTITSLVGLWIPAGLLHSGWTPAGTWHRAAQFNIGSVPAISEAPVAVEITPLLRLLLDRLCMEDLSEPSRRITEAQVVDVLGPARQELVVQRPEAPLLAPIVEAVSRDPADGTSLQEWAHRLGVSTRTLTRLFQAETGLGFTRWIAAARAQQAIVLLSRGTEIDETAAAVGYGSASAFSTSFRRSTGMTPGQFRSC